MLDSELAMKLFNRFHLFSLSIAISNYYYCSVLHMYLLMNECPIIEKLSFFT